MQFRHNLLKITFNLKRLKQWKKKLKQKKWKKISKKSVYYINIQKKTNYYAFICHYWLKLFHLYTTNQIIYLYITFSLSFLSCLIFFLFFLSFFQFLPIFFLPVNALSKLVKPFQRLVSPSRICHIECLKSKDRSG